MKRTVALTAAATVAAAPLAAAVVQAPSAAADNITVSGRYTSVWNPSPTWTAVYEVCDTEFPACVPFNVDWFMYDSADYKGWSGGYFTFPNDHFFIDERGTRNNPILLPTALTYIARFNENGQQGNTYGTRGDDCISPGADWVFCSQESWQDYRRFISWSFAGIAAVGSDDPSVIMYGTSYAGYQFK